MDHSPQIESDARTRTGPTGSRWGLSGELSLDQGVSTKVNGCD